MAGLLKINLRTHFIYYRRSRLLLAFALVFLGFAALSSIPAIFSQSKVDLFAVLRELFTTLNQFLMIFSAGLSLFVISSHLRARNLKMVFTKPCPPALWLFTAYLSAVVASLAINLVMLACALILSLIWRTPVQAGLAFVSLDGFAVALGLIAYLMFLAMVLHPVIAAIVPLFLSPSTFYGMDIWLRATLASGTKSAVLRALERVFHFFYMVLPVTHAFSEKTQGVWFTLRADRTQWLYLLGAFGYALALSALFYCLSLLSLQRKRLI